MQKKKEKIEIRDDKVHVLALLYLLAFLLNFKKSNKKQGKGKQRQYADIFFVFSRPFKQSSYLES